MKTLILGLGNSVLGDDAVGLAIASGLRPRIISPDTDVIQVETGGINLLELLVGYGRAIIIDAIQTNGGIHGEIYRLGLDALNCTRRTGWTHGIDLAAVIKLGERLGLTMPKDIVIFAVEARDVQTLSERMCPEVQQAVRVCIEKILQEINQEAAASPGQPFFPS